MTIEQRLERLERQNRHLKNVLYAVVLSGLSLFIMGQTRQGRDVEFRTITAKKIFVEDENGKTGIILFSSPILGGSIGISNPDEKLLAAIGVHDDGKHGAISTYNADGRLLVVLGASPSGGGVITTYDGSGKKTIHIGPRIDTGEPVIAVLNRAGNVRAFWPLK
ncbi:MAG: hypothetical protein AAB289_05250 [Chloroflexota bacterium]